MRPILRFAVLAVLLSLCWAASASGATLHLIGDFDQPIYVTSSPDDPNELFVVEREGRVIQVGGGTPGVFAAYTGKVAAGGAVGDVHLDAFHHDGGVLVREPILSIGHSDEPNHNGGQLQFGPDGALYVSTGDGGGGGDPLESGQSLTTLLGKILRVEPHPGGQPEIWSYGLRNPWRFSFDRANGNMVIADVGQGAREEVDLAPSPGPGSVGGSGANYGWSCREGFIAYIDPAENCDGVTGFAEPVFDYPHADPGNGAAHGCSITGGYVVRDPSLGDLYGRYLYADFCAGQIRSLILPPDGGLATGDRSEGLDVSNPVSFGEDSCGRVYVVAIGGAVYRFEGATSTSCTRPSAMPAAAPTAPAGSSRPHTRVQLRKRAHRDKGGLRLILTARISPCLGQQGAEVQLNRGGRHIDTQRLNQRCVARFRLRIDRRATFRALLAPTGADESSRSTRLVVPPVGPG